MRIENIEKLSPAAMRRRACQFDEDALELARRAQQLRIHANEILKKRKEAKRVEKNKTYNVMLKRIRSNR